MACRSLARHRQKIRRGKNSSGFLDCFSSLLPKMSLEVNPCHVLILHGPLRWPVRPPGDRRNLHGCEPGLVRRRRQRRAFRGKLQSCTAAIKHCGS